MYVCLDVASRIDGVVKLSSGNYGGKLGQHRIYLRDILRQFSGEA
jgi:formylmethanofuran--tetrahydromethanopterin N-formyltransferase